MKTRKIRSILALAAVVTSITASLSPAQAFTWDDVWNTIKKSAESSPQQENDFDQSPSAPTLALKCIKANGADARAMDDSESVVSVGRRAIKVHSAVYIYPQAPHELTCSIQTHPLDEKVALAFAIPDNSTLYNVRVNIYVNGQQRISEIMRRGQARKHVIDVTGASSYAYTLEPLDRSSGDIYFPHVWQ